MKAKFYEPRYKDGKVVALADVDIADGVTVRGFKVMKTSNGLFGGVPSKSYTVDGETRYWSQVVFETKEIRERFFAELIELYRASGEQPQTATCANG